jgi:hypothetical protein
MTPHRRIAQARTIAFALSTLTDSATLAEYADAHHARVKMEPRPDGRCLFFMVSEHHSALTPTFHDSHALLAHIYTVLERECVCPTIRERQ